MTDDLFEAYKAKVSELLKAKVPFGEHQKQAFEIIVGAETTQKPSRFTNKRSKFGKEFWGQSIWTLS